MGWVGAVGAGQERGWLGSWNEVRGEAFAAGHAEGGGWVCGEEETEDGDPGTVSGCESAAFTNFAIKAIYAMRNNNWIMAKLVNAALSQKSNR